MFKRTLFVAVLLMGAALPAGAQDIATRIFNIENQIRNLTGQLEELNHAVSQLQQQLAKGQQSGALEQAEPVQKLKSAKLVLAPEAEQGVEAIGEEPVVVSKPKSQAVIVGAEEQSTSTDLAQAPVENADGIAVVPEGQDVASATLPLDADGAVPADSIEQVSLTPATETPEALYERWYEALLRRQYADAETGFKSFLEKYPDHSLAGSAQFQLGETYFAQGDFEGASKTFLQGYKNYPKSRRAPDSLLKLGLSLRKLGQKDQSCAALGSVGTEFPRAVEAKKRALAEYKRGGC